MMDFGALPPEVNSAWIYTGPGAAPLMAAATTWHGLAVELGSTAAAYQAVVTRMAGELWAGSASASMVAAVTPYVAWMNTTAAAAEQAANQATAAAAAFETAFAMTVPPPVIAANRSLLMALVATNFLGQNTPAITATEAQYAQMWAQDAAAMYGYATGSAAASQVTPFAEPAQATNPAGLAGQAAAVSQAAGSSAAGNSQASQLVSVLPSVLQGLASPAQGSAGSSASSSLSGILGSLFDNSQITDSINGMVNTGAWNVASTLSTAVGFLSSLGSSAGSSLGTAGSAAAGGLTSAVGAVAPVASLGPAGLAGLSAFGGAPVSAALGQAGSVGMLSVPQNWAAGAPASTVSALPSAGMAMPAANGASAVPAGLPIAAGAGRGGPSGNLPQYGFKPSVVAHPVLAG
uniref:PPE family protein n=2 Tax=Mycobacterium sp. P7213 TaxID=2478465 RepID=UPI003216D02E